VVTLPPPADIQQAFDAATRDLHGTRFELQWYPSVTSTMDVAHAATASGCRSALVIGADEQTRGRGRRGRSWSSPPGAGLYVTFALHPRGAHARPNVSLFTLAAGVAVRQAIVASCAIAPRLKWPNDVVVDGRKLAGILAEGLGIGSPTPTLLLGIGINLTIASHPEEVAARATSIEALTQRTVARAAVFERLIVQVAAAYDALLRDDTDAILREWRSVAVKLHGARVEWESMEGAQSGITAGIDQSGALLVRTAGGVKRLLGGELRWL
jgi:BirA family transcriptional regulator, biotin operon repressor / biotin---[acetyl-CoA-carboxylase] ligase